MSVICANCGHENSDHRQTCKVCRELLTAAHSNEIVNDYASATSKYEYKVVPFIGKLNSGVFTIDNAGKVTQQLQEVINKNAVEGWDYYRVDKINILVKPGCLASLLGARADFITFDQIIFRRARA